MKWTNAIDFFLYVYEPLKSCGINKNGEGGIPSDTPKHPMTRDVTAFVKRGEIPTTFPTTL